MVTQSPLQHSMEEILLLTVFASPAYADQISFSRPVKEFVRESNGFSVFVFAVGLSWLVWNLVLYVYVSFCLYYV